MEKLHLYDKILSPLVTEKSTNLSEQNKIIFKVNKKANKKNLKNNIDFCYINLENFLYIHFQIFFICFGVNLKYNFVLF